MFGLSIIEGCFYIFFFNFIINILISLLNKDFRNGNHFGQILQLKIIGYLPWLIVPFFLFFYVIKSLVKNEKYQLIPFNL